MRKEAKEIEQLHPPLTEEEIFVATVGPPDVLNNTIQLVDYNSDWSSLFTQLEQEIRDVLGNKVLLLEHVGSTSVPRLSAKPTIDMVLVFSDSSHELSYLPQLGLLGYVLKIREPNWYEHRVLKLQATKANLHVFSAGCEEIERSSSSKIRGSVTS